MSSQTRLLLIRHATTPKVGKALTGWLPGVSLDEPGREQARGLIDRLKAVQLDAIYSSPLERTIETAQPLARERNLDIHQNPDLGEVNFGDWQGKTLAEIDPEPEWKRFNSFRSMTRAPGGELMLETQARMVRGLLTVASANDGKTVAVFSHADAIKTALMHALGIPLDFHHRLEISPASITLFEMYSDITRVIAVNTQKIAAY